MSVDAVLQQGERPDKPEWALQRLKLSEPHSSTWTVMNLTVFTLKSVKTFAMAWRHTLNRSWTPKSKIEIFSRGKCLSRENGSQIFKVKKFCLTSHITAQRNYFWKLINHMCSPHRALSLPKQIAFIVKTTNLGFVINTIVLWAVGKGTWRCSFAWLSRNKDWSALLFLVYGSSVGHIRYVCAKHCHLIPLQNHRVNSFSSVPFCKHFRVQPQLIC